MTAEPASVRLRAEYGWAEIDPDGAVEAGSWGTWRLTYHVGNRGVDDGGVVKFAWRDVSDWGKPQFDDPGEPDYATVTTSGPATLRAAFERQRYVRPWRLCVTVDVFDDSLAQGDEVVLTLGEKSGGSPGSRAQTFCAESFEFRVAVDWCGTWVYTEVPSPAFEVVSGSPHRLVAGAPSEVAVGEPFWVGLKAEDAWGNPCSGYRGEVDIEAVGLEGLPEHFRFGPALSGISRFEGVVAAEPGRYWVRARDVDEQVGTTAAAITCRETAAFRPYWGDLHGQSGETVGTNPVSSYFLFARNAAWLDFAGHQGNDFQITDAVWEEIRACANGINEDGRFVAFVGYEWSGNTPVGGDRNVYYPGDDGPLLHSSEVLIPEPKGEDCPHVTDLQAGLAGEEALVIPHVGGRYANLEWHDARLEPLIEVYSEWGEFEWFLRDAIARGYRIGFTCGSDDHKGRPGAAHPGAGAFGVYGGLTCVWATELSRAALWEALRARRCYGTTGPRIGLRFQVDGHPMGAEIEATGKPRIKAEIAGTAAIERVDLFRGLELVQTWPRTATRREDTVRVAWSGQRIYARNRLLRWDGSLQLDRGRIVAANGYAFDSQAEGIRRVEERLVTWESVTTGDADGVLLELDAPPDATLSFASDVVSHSVTLGALAEAPIEVVAGGIDVKVVFEREPIGIGTEVVIEYEDASPPPGCNPYWLRVTQTDGARAWASPVYVTQGQKERIGWK